MTDIPNDVIRRVRAFIAAPEAFDLDVPTALLAALPDPDAPEQPACRTTQYDDRPCNGPADFTVTYRSSSGNILDQHPACSRHAIAEQNWAIASASIATVDYERTTPR